MSDISLRLVHSRSFLGTADDLALTLLLSLTGLIAEFAVISSGFLVPA